MGVESEASASVARLAFQTREALAKYRPLNVVEERQGRQIAHE